jgi:hypothetical protein
MILKKRKAVAMIELIFAIVIMGFALLSIPNLLALSANSGYTSLQQEAIATASADISLILSREWDESNTIDIIGEVILETDGDNNLVARDGGRTRIKGIIPIGASGVSSLKADIEDGIPDSDDIDDSNGEESVLTTVINTSNTQTGNVDNSIKINTKVIYISDNEKTGIWDSSSEVIFDYPTNPTALSTRSNIKNIKTTLTSNTTVKELEKNIVMSAFSCNIGGYKIERKVLP